MNITKGNSWILRIGVVPSCQKLGIILVINWFEKCCDQKMTITKNVLKILLFDEKMGKISMISDIENWLCNSNFGTF